MALPKTGSKSFQSPRSYEQTQQGARRTRRFLEGSAQTESVYDVDRGYRQSPVGASQLRGQYAPITVNGMYADSAATRGADIMQDVENYRPPQQNPMGGGSGMFSLPPERSPSVQNRQPEQPRSYERASSYDATRQPPKGLTPSQMQRWGQSRQEAARMNVGGGQPSSAYDSSRQPPPGLSPSQMRQWGQSRQEAARMSSPMEDGIRRPRTPAAPDQNPMPGIQAPVPQQPPIMSGIQAPVPQQPPIMSGIQAPVPQQPPIMSGIQAPVPQQPPIMSGEPVESPSYKLRKQFGQFDTGPPAVRPAYPQGPRSRYDIPATFSNQDLTGTQGKSTLSTMALHGAQPGGFAGAVASGYLASLGTGYAAANLSRNAVPNGEGPLQNPMQSGPWDQRGVDNARTQEFLGRNPMVGSSSQAAMAAGRVPANLQNPATMGSVNQYNGFVADVNDPNRMTPDQKFALAQQSAERYGESDPTGMRGRFGAGSALGRQASAIEAGEAGVAAGTHIQTSRGYGETPTYVERVPFSADELGEERKRAHTRVGGSTRKPGPLSAAESAAYDAKAPARRDASRVRKALEQDRRDTVKFKHLASRGMNPMSPQARAMFPNQVARMEGKAVPGQNPMGSPFATNAPNTPENYVARKTARQVNFDGSPTLQAFGAAVDLTPMEFAGAIYNGSASSDVSDEGLEQIFDQVKTFTPDKGKDSPFTNEFGGDLNDAHGGDMFTELWNMPEDTPVSKLREWHTRYKANTKSRKDRLNTEAGDLFDGMRMP